MIRSVGCPYPGSMGVLQKITICDATLREGELVPGVAFMIDEKLELAKRLDDIGVGQILLPMLRTDARLTDIAKQLCALNLRADTEVMTVCSNDNWKEQIDIAANVGADIIHSSIGVGPFAIPAWTDETKKKLHDRIHETVSCMKTTGMKVNMSFTDCTRADRKNVVECTKIAIDAGANRIRLADSFGITGPESWHMLVEDIVAIAKPHSVAVAVHCHNDLGLALADALACIRAGATIIDVSIGGLGDRAGNVCLEELAVALEVLYSYQTGIDTSKLTELCQYASSITGVPIAVNKPLVGANVFTEAAAGHAAEQFERPIEGRAFCPQDIGGKLGVVYGKMTTPYVLDLTAKRAGRELPRTLYPVLLEKLYIISEQRKGKPIYEEELWQIMDGLQ